MIPLRLAESALHFRHFEVRLSMGRPAPSTFQLYSILRPDYEIHVTPPLTVFLVYTSEGCVRKAHPVGIGSRGSSDFGTGLSSGTPYPPWMYDSRLDPTMQARTRFLYGSMDALVPL